MNRRTLLKSSISTLALSGCTSDSDKANSYPKHVSYDYENFISDMLNSNIKQKEGKGETLYKFSAPLPFNHESIDELALLNDGRYKKSKIVTLFNNVPEPASDNFNHWIMVLRGENKNIKGFKDFSEYAKHAMDKGFNICYLLNSNKPFSKKDFNTFKDDFYRLLDDIWNIGIKDVKIANTQVADLINNHNPEFNLSVSTTMELHNISQYRNLINNYPNIKLIDISKDENQNFELLYNLRQLYPDIEIELMVNEPCFKGCPARISHGCETDFCWFECKSIKEEYPISCKIKNGGIFPWHLKDYYNIGISNFKLLSLNYRAFADDTWNFKNYLSTLEYVLADCSLNFFLNELIFLSNKYTVSQTTSAKKAIQYLPDIKEFIKYGSNCATKCYSECRYCEEKAKELENYLNLITT